MSGKSVKRQVIIDDYGRDIFRIDGICRKEGIIIAGYTSEQAEKARNADLAAFVLRTDPEHHIREGNSVRRYDPVERKRKAISIKMGDCWYHDFSTGGKSRRLSCKVSAL